MNTVELIYQKLSQLEDQGAKLELVPCEDPKSYITIRHKNSSLYVAAGPLKENGLREFIEVDSPEYWVIYSVDGFLIENLPTCDYDTVRATRSARNRTFRATRPTTPNPNRPEPLVREIVYKRDIMAEEDGKLAPELDPSCGNVGCPKDRIPKHHFCATCGPIMAKRDGWIWL